MLGRLLEGLENSQEKKTHQTRQILRKPWHKQAGSRMGIFTFPISAPHLFSVPQCATSPYYYNVENQRLHVSYYILSVLFHVV